jgi:hypothetical protein
MKNFTTTYQDYRLMDEYGKIIELPFVTKDHRGDEMVIVEYEKPRREGSTGRIVTKEGMTYYPSVANLRIELVKIIEDKSLGEIVAEGLRYNGWRNYETWKIKLEFFDGNVNDYIDINEPPMSIYDLMQYLRSIVEDYIENHSSGMATDYAMNFVYECDFYEIADSFIKELEEQKNN